MTRHQGERVRASVGRPRAYEMYVAKSEPFPQEWKVTARYIVETARGRINCVRLHGFPSGHVVHLDEATLAEKFRRKDEARAIAKLKERVK
jgi:hypothetical protein